MTALRRWLAAVTAAVVCATGLSIVSAVLIATPAAALDGSQFRPGNIISDQLFFDGTAMSTSDVQAFLNAKGSACTAGAWCLKNFSAATNTRAAEPGLCNGYTGSALESAAQIIANVGRSCGISQKALLVTLQKEQGLVTATSPTSGKYNIAMGYGCPDSAPCDSQYYGFFNQVYMAARQFKRYAANPSNYAYRAGRTVNILFNPNSSCGSTPVYIENQATAGLYSYTPYQPNSSALTNLYGTGDACGSYGNRNFWRYYNDWFGSTQLGSDLVKSDSSATVYLVTPMMKYPISSVSVLASLAPLGGVSTVSQGYLDARTTGASIGPFVRDLAGRIYLADSGTLFPVTSCDQIAAWGRSCSEYVSMALMDSQIGRFAAGSPMGAVFRIPDGRKYLVSGAHRSQILDDASQVAAGIPLSEWTIQVSESLLATLPYVAPLVRSPALVADNSTGAVRLIDGGRTASVGRDLATQSTLARYLGLGALDPQSMNLLPAASADFTGVISGPTGARYAVTLSGAAVVVEADQLTQVTSWSATDALVTALEPVPPTRLLFARSATDGALFVVTPSGLKSVASMADFAALAGGTPPVIAVLSAAGVAQVPHGAVALIPGSMVRASNSSEVYLVDGNSTLVHVPSFSVTDALGVGSFRVVPPEALSGYTVAAGDLSAIITCSGTAWVGINGARWPVPGESVPGGSVVTTTLQSSTCAALPTGPAWFMGPVFARSTTSGAVSLLTGTSRTPMTSMSTVFSLAGNGPFVMVPLSDAVLAQVPAAALPPGAVVKVVGSPDIMLVDGAASLIRLPSFDVMSAAGLTSWSEVPATAVQGFTVAPQPLSEVVSCSGTGYVAWGGRFVPLPASTYAGSGAPATALAPATCAALQRSGTVWTSHLFIRSADSGSLYALAGGMRRHVTSMAVLVALTGGQQPVVAVVPADQLALVPEGPAIG